MTDKPALIIPVEVASRELDAKLLLSCLATQRGFSTYLGCRWRLLSQMQSLPPSIYIGKDVSRRALRIYDLLPKLGHTAMAWDEEALVYMTPEMYRRNKTWPQSLAAPKVLFAWGDDNAEIWRGTAGYDGQPIVSTGNPRADMLRPEVAPLHADAIEAIRSRFGRFVLLNSNFGWVNHFKESIREERRLLMERGSPQMSHDLVGTMEDPAMLSFRTGMMQTFLEILPRLADRFPDRAFVLRPHPSEDQAIWVAAAAGRSNVHVLHEGGVVPWLLAAEGVIQNGCTTGVEAFLLGRPVIAYRPFRHPLYDIPLPNALGTIVEDPDALMDAVAAVFDGDIARSSEAEPQRVARHFVASIDGPLASERILDAVEANENRRDLFDVVPQIDRWRGYLDCTVRGVKRRLGISGSHRSGQTKYLQHIYPPTSEEQIRHRIGRLRLAYENIGDVSVKAIGENLFALKAA